MPTNPRLLAGEPDRERVIQYLQVLKFELEMQVHQLRDELAGHIAQAQENARLYGDAQKTTEELHVSEAKLSGIVSLAADAIVSVDARWRITLFNEAAERMFGYARAEALGAALDNLIPERFRALPGQHLQGFAAGDEPHLTLVGLRKDGEEFPAEALISKLEVGGEKILIVTLRDLTEAKRLEREQRLLKDVGTVLAGALDDEEALTQLAQLAVRELADFCSVELVKDDGELRRLRVVARDPSQQGVCDALTRTPISQSRPQPALIPAVTPEMVASWAQSDEHLRLLREMRPRSIIVVPLVARGKVLGALEVVSSARSRALGPHDLRLMQELASRAALAIDKARLYRLAEQAIRRRDEVLERVGHDLRDPLNGIAIALALIERRRAAPEPAAQKQLEVIRGAAARMERLIEELLEVGRTEAGGRGIDPAPVGTD